MSSKKLAAQEQAGTGQSEEAAVQAAGIQGPVDAAMAHGNAAMQAFIEDEQALEVEQAAVEEEVATEIEVPIQVEEGAADADKEAAGPSNDVLLGVARSAIIDDFKNIFLPSEAFQQAFQAATSECNTTLNWDEVAAEVIADADAFGKGEYDDIFEEEADVTFAGRIWGLYTEATIGRDGAIQKIYFEID